MLGGGDGYSGGGFGRHSQGGEGGGDGQTGGPGEAGRGQEIEVSSLSTQHFNITPGNEPDRHLSSSHEINPMCFNAPERAEITYMSMTCQYPLRRSGWQWNLPRRWGRRGSSGERTRTSDSQHWVWRGQWRRGN